MKLVCILLFIASFVSITQARTESDTIAWRVAHINIKGNHAFSKSEISSFLKLKPQFLKKKPLYLHRNFVSDSLNIRALYQNAGFLKIDLLGTRQIYHAKKHYYKILWEIRENRPTQIDSIALDLSLPQLSTALQKDIFSKPGDNLNIVDIQLMLSRVETHLAILGYLEATTDYAYTLSHDSLLALLTISIDPGPQIQVGAVTITVPASVDAQFIERLVTFKENDILTSENVRASTNALYQTNLFSFVSITWDSTANAPDTLRALRNVRVTLQTRHFLDFEVGGGYKTYDNFYGNAQIQYRNFLRRGVTGLASAEFSLIKQNMSAGVTFPWIFLEPIDIDANASYAHIFEPAIGTERYITQVRVTPTWRIISATKLSLSYTWNTYNTLRSVQIDPLEAPVNSLAATLLYDTRSDPFNPQHGKFFMLTTGVSGLEGQKGNQTLEVKLDMRAYWKLSAHLVLSSAVRAGLVRPYGTTALVPSYQLYYAGGSSVMRGYAEKQMGERSASNLPLGGTAYGTLNCAELRFPIWAWLGGVAFLDVGTLINFNSQLPTISPGTLSISNIRYNAGTGLRANFSFIIISTDIGFNLGKKPQDDLYALHVSIGQAF